MPETEFGALGAWGVEMFFRQPEPRLLTQGQALLWPAPCPPTSVTSLRQTEPVGEPAGSRGSLLGSPEVPCEHVGLSATLASSSPCSSEVGIFALPSSPLWSAPVVSFWLLPVHLPRFGLLPKVARQTWHSEASSSFPQI